MNVTMDEIGTGRPSPCRSEAAAETGPSARGTADSHNNPGGRRPSLRCECAFSVSPGMCWDFQSSLRPLLTRKGCVITAECRTRIAISQVGVVAPMQEAGWCSHCASWELRFRGVIPLLGSKPRFSTLALSRPRRSEGGNVLWATL